MQSYCRWSWFPVTYPRWHLHAKRWLAFPLNSITSQWGCNLTHYIHHGVTRHRICKFSPSCPLFTQLIQQLLYGAGAACLPLSSTSKDYVWFLSMGTKWRNVEGGGEWVHGGGMGRAGPGRGVWLGINQGTVGFLLFLLFRSPLSWHPAPLYSPFLSLFLSLPSTHIPSRVGLFFNKLLLGLRHQSFGSSIEAWNHADVFGAGVGCPPGNR